MISLHYIKAASQMKNIIGTRYRFLLISMSIFSSLDDVVKACVKDPASSTAPRTSRARYSAKATIFHYRSTQTAIHDVQFTGETSTNLAPRSHHHNVPLDGNDLLSSPPTPQYPLPRLGPSHQPYYNHLHHLPSLIPCHLRHPLRFPRPQNRIPSYPHPLRAVEPGPRPGT